MINNVVLVGRLTRDPELRYTSNGTATATFNLAVNRNFTNASGEREADFVNCVIWRKPSETLVNYAKKGTLLGVVGRIQTRNYENQQGQKVYVTEVVCDNFQLLESRNANEQRQNVDDFNNQHKQQNNFNQDSDPFGSSSHIDINDDDLPF
ncbi:single-stranded DNA-binding protein [Vagococcus fluvialis]|uniref:single-stranded DNA-binding protein n=1 Tax=Vagococcus fluvialis TaxID=2738 RepID=UPI00289081EF|nr:single-stranded DNA-binding protein [Vagococcus fluvialis]MDT2782865.1 single-stranded DNA-binding protein [Vagococcus fluvialis]